MADQAAERVNSLLDTINSGYLRFTVNQVDPETSRNIQKPIVTETTSPPESTVHFHGVKSAKLPWFQSSFVHETCHKFFLKPSFLGAKATCNAWPARRIKLATDRVTAAETEVEQALNGWLGSSHRRKEWETTQLVKSPKDPLNQMFIPFPDPENQQPHFKSPQKWQRRCVWESSLWQVIASSKRTMESKDSSEVSTADVASINW